jgi:hypothetical protein
MNTSQLLLLLPVFSTAVLAQEPAIRVPERFHLHLDTLRYFHDPDTANTTIEVKPIYMPSSLSPHGKDLVLDLWAPSVMGLEPLGFKACDAGYTGLGGGMLEHRDSNEAVLKFGCGEGYTQVFLIDGCCDNEVVQVRYFQELLGEIYGFDATARLRVEKLEVPLAEP